MFDNPAIMKLMQLFLYCSLALITKDPEYLFDNAFIQDVIVCDDIGWWIGFDTGGNSIDNVGLEICNTVKFIGAND